MEIIEVDIKLGLSIVHGGIKEIEINDNKGYEFFILNDSNDKALFFQESKGLHIWGRVV